MDPEFSKVLLSAFVKKQPRKEIFKTSKLKPKMAILSLGMVMVPKDGYL